VQEVPLPLELAKRCAAVADAAGRRNASVAMIAPSLTGAV
jgi:hypothetical protein